MIDSHCHLAGEEFATDLDAVVARARAAGVTGAMCILSADDEAELTRAADVAAAWAGVRFATAIHPHRAGAYAGRAAAASEATRAAAARVDAAALGEMGLDYHYDFAPRDVQREVFVSQIALARELDRPIVIHTREATGDTLALLREAGGGEVRGIMHCFSGSADDLRRVLDLGFYASFAGILTFPKADSVRAIARLVPRDRVLVETDAPYLAPVPHRGKRNEPAWVAETVAQLAAVHGIDREAMAAQVADNFHRIVGPARAAR